jgi:hypothetical protein
MRYAAEIKQHFGLGVMRYVATIQIGTVFGQTLYLFLANFSM